MTIYRCHMTNAEIATEVARQIEATRMVEGRSVAWLSEQSGVSYKTLRRRLYGAPEQFTLAELGAIARALNTAVERLFAPAALAA